jgi:hypothetical protein
VRRAQAEERREVDLSRRERAETQDDDRSARRELFVARKQREQPEKCERGGEGDEGAERVEDVRSVEAERAGWQRERVSRNKLDGEERFGKRRVRRIVKPAVRIV